MYNIYNGLGQIVETAGSHVEALNVVTYLSHSEPTFGPYHCAPALVLA